MSKHFRKKREEKRRRKKTNSKLELSLDISKLGGSGNETVFICLLLIVSLVKWIYNRVCTNVRKQSFVKPELIRWTNHRSCFSDGLDRWPISICLSTKPPQQWQRSLLRGDLLDLWPRFIVTGEVSLIWSEIQTVSLVIPAIGQSL